MGARLVRDPARHRRLARIPAPGRALSARRAFLRRAAALALAAYAAPFPALALRRRFDAYPFALGVASGAPRADGVVLWTRLAPRPLETAGGLPDERCEAHWEVALDERFRRVVRRGSVETHAATAHAAHVEVHGLEPAREYYYRFVAGGESSPVGRTRTAPGPGRGDERLRLAFASCQQYEQGFFAAHRHLAAESPDLVAFLGDYIYESSWGREHVRKHGAPEPRTLDEYRTRHALYRLDADLQAAHACAPWIVTWDDHEVDNDYANDRSEGLDPAFLGRRAAAYRAFVEHMPLRLPEVLRENEVRIYARHAWGALAAIHVLDDRQYRSHQACPRAGRGGSAMVGPACAERLEAGRSLLGEAQERWLDAGFAQSRARWNLVAQQTLFAPAGRLDKEGVRVHWTDGWDGYPAARERLLASLVDRKVANPVLIGGDLHANYVADIRARDDERSPIVATEFCGTSVTSQGFPELTHAMRAANPDIRYADPSRRGYVVLDIGARGLVARLRCVASVKDPRSSISTAETFEVAEGRPGIPK